MAGRLSAVQFQVSNFSGSTPAAATSSTIWIDDNAAGLGWFIDSTRWDADEFDENGLATVGSNAQNRIDLLTAVLHELGHVLGLNHDDDWDSLMSDVLAVGTRRRVTPADLDALFGAKAVSNLKRNRAYRAGGREKWSKGKHRWEVLMGESCELFSWERSPSDARSSYGEGT